MQIRHLLRVAGNRGRRVRLAVAGELGHARAHEHDREEPTAPSAAHRLSTVRRNGETAFTIIASRTEGTKNN